MVYAYEIISIIASTVKDLTFQLSNKDYQICFFLKVPGIPRQSNAFTAVGPRSIPSQGKIIQVRQRSQKNK